MSYLSALNKSVWMHPRCAMLHVDVGGQSGCLQVLVMCAVPHELVAAWLRVLVPRSVYFRGGSAAWSAKGLPAQPRLDIYTGVSIDRSIYIIYVHFNDIAVSKRREYIGRGFVFDTDGRLMCA